MYNRSLRQQFVVVFENLLQPLGLGVGQDELFGLRAVPVGFEVFADSGLQAGFFWSRQSF